MKDHGAEALSLDGSAIRVVCIPGLGGKLTSIISLESGREWLVQPRVRLRPPAYGSVFTDADMSGWDEMFPTINPCLYPSPAGRAGTTLPDHGEVWAMPWTIEESTASSLTLSVEGRALPYRLTRTLSVAGPAALSMRYRVDNLGHEPLRWLWAAHPQFSCTPGTAVVLDETVVDVLQVCEPISGWIEAGAPVAWPWVTGPDGSATPLDRLPFGAKPDFRKLYVRPEQRLSGAALVDQESGERLRLSWDPVRVPYLGIWLDHGGFNDVPTIALEPSTGFYDDLAYAHRRGRAVTTAPQQASEWELVVTLDVGRGMPGAV